MPLEFLLCCRLMNYILSSDSEPLSAKISAKISSFLSVSIMITCTVGPTVPLIQCIWLERTSCVLGARLVGTAHVSMDACQWRAANKINLKAFQLVTKWAVGNELHHDSRLLLEPTGSKRIARKAPSSPWDRKGYTNQPVMYLHYTSNIDVTYKRGECITW